MFAVTAAAAALNNAVKVDCTNTKSPCQKDTYAKVSPGQAETTNNLTKLRAKFHLTLCVQKTSRLLFFHKLTFVDICAFRIQQQNFHNTTNSCAAVSFRRAVELAPSSAERVLLARNATVLPFLAAITYNIVVILLLCLLLLMCAIVVAMPLLPSQVDYLLLARTQQNGTNDATNCYPCAPLKAGGVGKWAWRHADYTSSTLISCLAIAHTKKYIFTKRM